jgi:hypothetical protein
MVHPFFGQAQGSAYGPTSFLFEPVFFCVKNRQKPGSGRNQDKAASGEMTLSASEGIKVLAKVCIGPVQGGAAKMKQKINIGIIQMASRVGDVKFNTEKAVAYIEKAADAGADIVVLPELFATG